MHDQPAVPLTPLETRQVRAGVWGGLLGLAMYLANAFLPLPDALSTAFFVLMGPSLVVAFAGGVTGTCTKPGLRGHYAFSRLSKGVPETPVWYTSPDRTSPYFLPTIFLPRFSMIPRFRYAFADSDIKSNASRMPCGLAS